MASAPRSSRIARNSTGMFLQGPFYGFNRPGAKVSQGVIDNWWRQGMVGGIKAHYDCIKAFSETDFTEDLKKIEVPALVMHGDDDQIVPIEDSALLVGEAPEERHAQGLSRASRTGCARRIPTPSIATCSRSSSFERRKP